MATKKKSSRRKASTASKGGGLKTVARTIGGRGPWWLATIRWIAFLAVTGIFAGAITFFVLYRTTDIPNANEAFQTQTTKVFYSDGKHKIGEFATQDRESVSIDQIPASMQSAAIAAEDRTFYTNRGIDIKGIIRAARNNATSGQIQGGGSTITQQYVKILYLTQERSYSRKVKEAILSIKIHNQRSKKEILEGYLNTIYFGNGAYGVEVAAQTYFAKSASDLNYAQSAFLATIINSPTYYDPYAEGAAARIMPRYQYVLDGMLKMGAITADERAKFVDRLPNFAKQRNDNRLGGTKGYLLSMIKKEMESDLGFEDTQIEGQGLRITTTFNYNKQKDAVKAVREIAPEKKGLHEALVSIQPGTGAVRALYGGPDYVTAPTNWATVGTQPGSTFKAFAVVAALENGYSLKTRLNGSSPLFIDGKIVGENQGDSGGESFGQIPLSFATQKSVNTAFLDLMDQMEDGPEKVLDAAQEAGIPATLLDRVSRSGPPLVTPLGYFPVSPIDMANSYATIAAGGKRADWFVVSKVQDATGKVIQQHKVTTKQTIAKDVAADTVSAMQDVVRAGTGTNGQTICPTAGKTGTATAGPDDDQHVSSSWFAGFTPKLATSVMYGRGQNGNEDLEGFLLPTFFGGQYPATTFRTYMNAALEGSTCGTFPPAANIKAEEGTTYVPPAPKPTKKPKPKPKPTKTTPEPTPTPTPTPTKPTKPTKPTVPVPTGPNPAP